MLIFMLPGLFISCRLKLTLTLPPTHYGNRRDSILRLRYANKYQILKNSSWIKKTLCLLVL